MLKIVIKAVCISLAILGTAVAVYGLSWYLWLQEINAFSQAYMTSDYLKAQRHIKSCLWLSAPCKGYDPRYVKSLQFQAALYAVRRELNKAISVQEDVLKLARENKYSPLSFGWIVQQSAMALLLRKAGRYAEAENRYIVVITTLEVRVALAKKIAPPDDPETAELQRMLAEALDYSSWVLIKEKKFSEAEAMLNRCLDLTKQEYGPDSFKLISPQVELAYLKNEQGKWNESRPLLDKALSFLKKQTPGTKTSAYTTVAILTMANLFRDHDCPKEAEESYKLAIDSCKLNVAGAENNLFMTDILTSYAKLLEQQSRQPEAEKLKAEAKRIREQPPLE
ncbi:MAG: tetratricopeptide repeat protein [Candidatus Obscuribacterales bacterium]|nr:tetratricopeptide repeat protein [Candidatus Obscuribacterales bacterium]